MQEKSKPENDPGLEGDEINTLLQGMDFTRAPELNFPSIPGTFTGKDGVTRDLREMPSWLDVVNESKAVLSVPAGIGKSFAYSVDTINALDGMGGDYDGNTALWPTKALRLKRRFGNPHAIHRSRTMRTKR